VACAALALAAGAASVGDRALAAAASAAQTGSWASAAALSRTAARWQPWSASPRRLLGEAEVGLGDPAAARQAFERAAHRDPHDWRTWYALARLEGGDARAAAVKKILQLNPLAVRRAAR
jgi:Flp pilus assembly protein TadD